MLILQCFPKQRNSLQSNKINHICVVSMKTLETGQEKIKKICDDLRHKTIEPAKEEAHKIIADAKIRAENIILDAKKNADTILEGAHRAIEQERNVFHSSLLQASKQSLEALRQDIEHKLFNADLVGVIESASSDPTIITKIIEAIIHAIEKEGITSDLSAIISEKVSPEKVNQLLGEKILKRLKEHSVLVGDFAGGAQVRVHQKKMTIDITDSALNELLSSYVRKDFRKLFFAK